MHCAAAAFCKTCELQAQSSNRGCNAQRDHPFSFRFPFPSSTFVVSESHFLFFPLLAAKEAFVKTHGRPPAAAVLFYYYALRLHSQLPALLQSPSFSIFYLSSVTALLCEVPQCPSGFVYVWNPVTKGCTIKREQGL